MFMSHKTEGGGLLPPAVEIGGPFTLASSRGGTVLSADLAGKPYAVFFGFTHCPEVCPTTLYELSGSLEKLGNAASGMRVFFITVDPERDTVESLRDYLASFDPRIEGLVPTLADLPRLASDFRVYYTKSPTSDGSYTMDHTASIFLFDAAGRFSGTLAYGEATVLREAKLRRLLGLP
jgi:protein SCO1/2